MLATIVHILIAICLLGTVIGAFIRYVKTLGVITWTLEVPDPFAWVQGVIIFVMIALACYFLWDLLVAPHVLVPPHKL